MGRGDVAIDRAVRYLEAIYGPFGPRAGVAASTLKSAERRLGIALPHALAALYLRTGRVKALHTRHNRLLALTEVAFTDDHLVFYEENQNVVCWAIARAALAEADPPVVQGQADDRDRWSFFPEFRSVSEFLEAQGTWQAVQGGLPFVGVAGERAPPKVPRRVDHRSDGMTAWLVEGGVVMQAGPDFLGLATRDAAQFTAASKVLGLEVADWDHATLQEP